MRKINKTNIALIVICAILLTNTAYGIDLSKESLLRKPLVFNDAEETGRYQYVSLVSNLSALPYAILKPEQGKKFAKSQGIDYRPVQNGLMEMRFVGYDTALRKIINPEHEDLVSVYGGGGPDISNLLISTDAARSYIIDKLEPGKSEVDIEMLEKLKNKEWDSLDKQDWAVSYLRTKRSVNIALAEKNNYIRDIEKKIILELKSMGVKKNSIRFLKKDGLPTMEFTWAYPGQFPKQYTISYIGSDLLQPDEYMNILRELTKDKGGIDIYYQKGSVNAPERYRDFLFNIAQTLKKGGFIVTDDVARYERRGQRYVSAYDVLREADPDGYLYLTMDNNSELKVWEKAILDMFNLGEGYEHDGYGWRMFITQKFSSRGTDRDGSIEDTQSRVSYPQETNPVASQVEEERDVIAFTQALKYWAEGLYLELKELEGNLTIDRAKRVENMISNRISDMNKEDFISPELGDVLIGRLLLVLYAIEEFEELNPVKIMQTFKEFESEVLNFEKIILAGEWENHRAYCDGNHHFINIDKLKRVGSPERKELTDNIIQIEQPLGLIMNSNNRKEIGTDFGRLSLWPDGRIKVEFIEQIGNQETAIRALNFTDAGSFRKNSTDSYAVWLSSSEHSPLWIQRNMLLIQTSTMSVVGSITWDHYPERSTVEVFTVSIEEALRSQGLSRLKEINGEINGDGSIFSRSSDKKTISSPDAAFSKIKGERLQQNTLLSSI